jgi:formyl-CoA transferase
MTASTQPTWERCAQVIGHPELIEDPRFLDNGLRVQHAAELAEYITAWYAARDRDEALALMDAAGVPVSPINSIADIFADPHIQARQNIIEVEHPTLGTVKMPGLIPKFSRTPGRVRHAGPPQLGAFNDEVYGDLLGLSENERARLAREGVI